ncbi:MAG: XRE family transcriptional regulator [Escherichia coli]|nr:XRE family transcriptional regulator [Escherichia coli]
MMINENIRRIRQQRQMTLQEVADAVNVSRQTIQRYESGVIGNIPYDNIKKIAGALNVSPADIMGWSEEENNVPSLSAFSYSYVPEPISAGLPIEVSALGELPQVTVPDALLGKYARNKNIIIMPINGRSMDKIIPDGSYIAVKTNIEILDLANKDIVVFAHNGEYAVKQFFDIDGKLVFRPASTDPSFLDLVIPKADADNVLIIGKVIMYNIILD